jgi:hypothetical protein
LKCRILLLGWLRRSDGGNWNHSVSLQMLQLLSLPFLFLSALALRTVVQQKCQSSTKREDDKRFEDIGVNLIAVVAIATVNMVFVVVRFVVIPACQLRFEEGTEPL